MDRLEHPRGFHAVRLKSRTEQYDLLCLQHLAWVGFCHSAPAFMGFDTGATFRDPPRWPNLLAEDGHRVLIRTEPALPSPEIDISELIQLVQALEARHPGRDPLQLVGLTAPIVLGPGNAFGSRSVTGSPS